MIVKFDMVIKYILNEYRKKVFLAKISNKRITQLNILGEIFLWNKKIKIGNNVTIYPNVTFAGNGEIIIGNNVKIGSNTILFANNSGGVTIGDNTIIAAFCYIIDSNHQISKDNLISCQPLTSTKVSIGNDVWIGEKSSVLPGTIIEDGVVIGAHSLVNKHIDKHAIAVGVPARIIKYRKISGEL